MATTSPKTGAIPYRELRPHLHEIDRAHERSGECYHVCMVDYLDTHPELDPELKIAVSIFFQQSEE